MTLWAFLLVFGSFLVLASGQTVCPDGSRPVNCFANPCDVSNGCYNIPMASCRPYYCGGCSRRWYVGFFEVTNFCYPR
uniref:ShKT domain-containing protein n=1 Tax=Magallana gigas TaxID=29159 RepID=A0A8W8NWI7_MAGGI